LILKTGGKTMALTLSSSLSSTLEPLRKNRWVIQFTSVPGGGSAEQLAFAAHAAQRPGIAYNVTEFQRLNERFYIAGKPTWTELPMTFFDYIRGADSASEILWNWNQVVYSPITGAMGFKKEYSTTATLGMLDPAGGIVQVWNLFYIWPYNITWGELNADDDTLAEVSVTFRYDFAIKGTDVDTAS
jgi:hypothetical protein